MINNTALTVVYNVNLNGRHFFTAYLFETILHRHRQVKKCLMCRNTASDKMHPRWDIDHLMMGYCFNCQEEKNA